MQKLFQQHTTHLWVGSPQEVVRQVKNECIDLFGKNNKTTIAQINNQEHPWITWLHEPYKTTDIDALREKTKFSLPSSEYRVFVFQQAHAMLATSANRLLKTIEEPHENYIFIFCTQTPQLLLPTIRSRCLKKVWHQEDSHTNLHSITPFFTSQTSPDPVGLHKALDSANIKELETVAILDEIATYWQKQCEKNIQNPQQLETTLSIMSLVTKYYTKLPKPGSAKLFWKTMYVEFYTHLV